MEKFTHDEISLIDNIINLILKKDQKFKLYGEHFSNGWQGHYNTERVSKHISYNKVNFNLFFDKWYINKKPTLKSKINKFLSKDKYQSPNEMYPGTGQLRTNFQKGEDSGWSHGSYDIWNKQLIVKGFTISDGDDGGGTLYFHNNKAHDKLYIQTNDINIAKEKTNKFFFKLLMDAMEREIKKTL
jgi:hypothetical protein